eukprot:363874-Alexandrium_andersonii.AAC.1
MRALCAACIVVPPLVSLWHCLKEHISGNLPRRWGLPDTRTRPSLLSGTPPDPLVIASGTPEALIRGVEGSGRGAPRG